jgi:hypothetical protein
MPGASSTSKTPGVGNKKSQLIAMIVAGFPEQAYKPLGGWLLQGWGLSHEFTMAKFSCFVKPSPPLRFFSD